jgi:hypothetical protein
MPQCKLENCPISKDGRCLENRNGDCPNLVTSNVVASEGPLSDLPEISDSVAPVILPTEPLYSGSPLEIVDAREFCRRSRATVVSLAGMSESGKTSLLARLYQMFQMGSIGSYDFAGSRTLYRFEELNWLAMVESGVGSPTMEKSSRRYDNSFLHLTVKKRTDVNKQIDILLNDISGETYPDVIAAETISKQLVCLQRADHLVVVVDGGAIADLDLRHDHFAKAKNFIDRVLRTGQIGQKTALHLVISKLDKLRGDGDAAENEEATSRFESECEAQFAPRVAKFHRWRIAARPMDASSPTVETIAELFTTLVGTSYRYPMVMPPRAPQIESNRDFCRFGV